MSTDLWLAMLASLLVVAAVYAVYRLERWLWSGVPEEKRYRRYCETEPKTVSPPPPLEPRTHTDERGCPDASSQRSAFTNYL